MVTYNDDTRTATGTAGRDVLKGKPSAPWELIGLGGNDTYHLRIAEYVRKIVAGSVVIYERYRGVDHVVEKNGGGHDTVILSNGYRSANSIAASQLANIEDIKVASGATWSWRIESNNLSNHVTGGAGGDILLGQGGADRMDGGKGNDSLFGGTGNDSLYGGIGNDALDGGIGVDSLYGGDGNDLLIVGAATDRHNGGGGNDTISYARWTGPISIDIGRQTSSVGKLSSIESAITGKGNDKLTGSGGINTLDGGDGDDRIAGGGGADTLIGKRGNDQLSGEDGNDKLYGGPGNDKLAGGNGKDALNGGGGADTLTGGEGTDTFVFEFSVKRHPDDLFVTYDRTIAFDAVIQDFHDGSDPPFTFPPGNEDPLREKITIVPATARSAGVGSDTKGPTAESIWLENPDNHFLLNLTASRRSLDPGNWEGSSAVVIHFGDPANDGRDENLDELYFGSVTVPGVTIGDITESDFIFG